jgi:hypothetical protein
MRKFLIQTALFLALLLGVFLALELPIQINYYTQISERSDWQCLDSINADILIVGNSRVEGGFDPIAIDKATGLETYLLTQSGWEAPILRKKLENYMLVNEPPIWLVIQADPIHLTTRSDWYDKKQFLKYLFLDRENLQETMRPYEGYHWYEFAIPFIRYRGVPNRYIRDALGIPMELNKIKGYKPKKERYQHEPIPYDSCVIELESVKILQDFFSLSPNSMEMGVYPLVSSELYEKTFGVANIEHFCAAQGIHFVNANELIQYKPDSIYSNHTHTNIYGAQMQTQLMIDYINDVQLP